MPQFASSRPSVGRPQALLVAFAALLFRQAGGLTEGTESIAFLIRYLNG